MITLKALNKIFGFEFSDEQLESITADLDKPLQVVAGAGSGKTTVMVARIVWAVGTGAVRPDQVLGLTFTNKAAGELARSVAQKLMKLDELGLLPSAADEIDEPTVATYHKFANKLVADFGLRVGIEPGSRLLSDGEPEQLAYRLVMDSRRPLQLFDSAASTIAQYVITLDQELAEHLVTTDQVRDHSVDLLRKYSLLSKQLVKDTDIAVAAQKRTMLADLVDDFRSYKLDQGVVDFSDLMRAASELSQVESVGQELREQFKLVLLDEYQDTSVVQARFLHNFFGEGHPVTAVGDPFQAIYGWRGASEMAMNEFPGLFTEVDGQRARQTNLTASRRCSPHILHAANTVAEPLRQLFPEVRQLVSVGGSHRVNTVECAMLLTDADEYDWIGQSIESLVQAGVAPSEIAVLCRENKAMKPIIEELSRRGVKTQISDVGGLLAQPEVVDLVSWLRVLNDPGANPAILRILQGPRWRVGPRDLAILGRRARDLAKQEQVLPATEVPVADSPKQSEEPQSFGRLNEELEKATQGVDVVDVPCLLDAVESPVGREGKERYAYSSECLERLAEVSELLKEFRLLKLLTLPELARYVARTTGLESEVTLAALEASADIPGGIALDRGLTSLSAFYDLLSRFGLAGGDQSLSSFINWLDVSSVFDNELKLDVPASGEAVQFLTVHGAKGLEWKYVFVPRVVSRVFPSSNPRPRWTTRPERVPHKLRGDRDAIPDQEGFGTKPAEEFARQMREHAEREERRLAYVAFTRAKEALFVSGAWWDQHSTKVREVSPYLLNVLESVLETGRVANQWVQDPGDESPIVKSSELVDWPRALNSEAFGRRTTAQEAVAMACKNLTLDPLPSTPMHEQVQMDQWDTDLRLLLAERRSRKVQATPQLPSVLSATAIGNIDDDRTAFLQRLQRPMPWPPSAAAERGTRFHAWVEQHYGKSVLFEEVPGEVINDSLTERELGSFKEYFLSTDYAGREPYAVELPFDYLVAGTVVNGRIDAVFKTEVEGRTAWEVVDWKTNSAADADPLQLGVYALAIQRLFGADPVDVTGTFVYVNAEVVVSYVADELPGESEISKIINAD